MMVSACLAGPGRLLGSRMATRWSSWRMTGMPGWCPPTLPASTGSTESTRCAFSVMSADTLFYASLISTKKSMSSLAGIFAAAVVHFDYVHI